MGHLNIKINKGISEMVMPLKWQIHMGLSELFRFYFSVKGREMTKGFI